MLTQQIQTTYITLEAALANEDFERAILLLKVLQELLYARKLEIEVTNLEPDFKLPDDGIPF